MRVIHHLSGSVTTSSNSMSMTNWKYWYNRLPSIIYIYSLHCSFLLHVNSASCYRWLVPCFVKASHKMLLTLTLALCVLWYWSCFICFIPTYIFTGDTSNNCGCKNGGRCLPNGKCDCFWGFHGAFCQLSCPENFYGQNCGRTCTCGKNAICTPDVGNCRCKDSMGWVMLVIFIAWLFQV